jgi:hypothetical protein
VAGLFTIIRSILKPAKAAAVTAKAAPPPPRTKTPTPTTATGSLRKRRAAPPTPAASATPGPPPSAAAPPKPPASASPLYLASLKGHDAGRGGVAGLAWSPCGNRLASAGGGDWLVRVSADPRAAGGGPPVRREVGAAPLGVAFVPQAGGGEPAVAVLTRGGDGPALAALGAGRTPLWTLPAPGDAFLGGHRALAVRSGAGVLAVASEKAQLEVYALPAVGGACPARLAAVDTAGLRTQALAVSANGGWVAAATLAPEVRLHALVRGGGGRGRVLVRGPVLTGHAGPVLAVALAGDGSAAATSCRDGTVAAWSLPAWTRHDTEAAGPPARLRWRAPAPLPAGFAYRFLALDPTGAVLAGGTERGDLHFLDAGSGALLAAVEPAHGGGCAITALEWAPAPRGGSKAVLASAGEDGAVHLWASPLDVAA